MNYLSELLIFILVFQLITALIGSIYFYKYKTTFLKYFLFFLWYVAINDIVGYILNSNSYEVAWLYNTYYLLTFNYLMILFRHYLSSGKQKKWIVALIVIYNIAVLINSFFESYFDEFSTIPYIIGASFVIISIFFYYVDTLNSEKVLYVNKNILFWISIGFLIYYSGNIPFRIVRNYAGDLVDASIQFLVLCFLSFIMNLCFIRGFIWANKKRQY